MKCPRCQQDNPSHAKFCLECGVPFGSKNGPSARSYTDLQRALAEALEQQTATEEILRVISQSPTDLQPVLDTIARNAAIVCGATDVLVSIRDGDESVTAAHYGDQEVVALGQRRPIIRGLVVGRSLLEARPVQVEDITQTDEFPEGRAIAVRMGHRTVMAVPLLRNGVAIGSILMRRTAVNPFTDKQIALLQTFADQAVIAIENVRLFNELQEKNKALTQAHAQVTESLERQTATSEILSAISGAQTDINPVFDAIARSAVKLCGAFACRVFRAGDELLPVVGEAYGTPEARALFHGTHPEAVGRDSPSAIAARERRVVQYADVPNDPDVPERYRERARARGYRALMAVPMVRDEVVFGTITVARQEAVPFSERQIALVKMFADQAVIAIENVRLFTELQTSNRYLTGC
jgi:two-component system, NtrC family, sensor kinase